MLPMIVSPIKRFVDRAFASVAYAGPDDQRSGRPVCFYIQEMIGGADRNRTGVRGFAVRWIATLPPRLRGSVVRPVRFDHDEGLLSPVPRLGQVKEGG